MSNVPRALVLSALLTGCTAGTGTYVPPDPEEACETLGADWVPSSQQQLAFSTLIVNGLAVVPDVASYRGCIQSAEGATVAAAWFFGAEGGDYGLLISEATQPGAVTLPSPLLTVDLYGASPPITFEGTDFNSGNFVVNTVDPYGLSLQDASATTNDGHALAIALTASAAL